MLTSSTVYGAAGADTFNVSATSAVRIDLGSEPTTFLAPLTFSALLFWWIGVDQLFVGSGTTSYVDAGAGADSLVFTEAMKGANANTLTTILGGTGADTLDFNGVISYATVLGGTDTASLIDAGGQVTSSTLRGGTGNDTISFGAAATGLVAVGGTGADSMTFSGSTGSSIYAGSGNDSVVFSGTVGTASTTYYFGKTDGKDTLAFGSFTGGKNVVIAVDAASGATSGVQFSGVLDAGTGTSGTITFNNADSGVATGTLFLTTSLVAARLLVQVSPTSPSSPFRRLRSPLLADQLSDTSKMGPSGPLFFVSAIFSLA